MSTSIIEWFGDEFHQLHPALQELHTNGGTLAGPVTITLGRSWVARWIGKKLAKKMGVPIDLSQSTHQSQRQLTVSVAHQGDGMHWGRDFGAGTAILGNDQHMTSVFQAVRTKANNGYIMEATGVLRAKLSVDVVQGGWYWKPLKMYLGKLPLPVWLFPKSHAYKRVNGEGAYEFSVSFSVPLLGVVLSYAGPLAIQ